MYRWDVENKEGYSNRMGHYKTSCAFDFMRKYTEGPMRILDIGGGAGRFAIPLCNDGHQVTVVDKASEAISIIRERCSEVECIHGEFPNVMPGQEHRYDVIISIEVLYYVRDWASFFSKVHTLLEKDGIFIFSVPNRFSWRSILQKCNEKVKKQHYGYKTLSIREYSHIIEQSGLVVDDVTGFLWIPCKVDSDSKMVEFFARVENMLHLRRFLAQSPWLLYAVRKT